MSEFKAPTKENFKQIPTKIAAYLTLIFALAAPKSFGQEKISGAELKTENARMMHMIETDTANHFMQEEDFEDTTVSYAIVVEDKQPRQISKGRVLESRHLMVAENESGFFIKDIIWSTTVGGAYRTIQYTLMIDTDKNGTIDFRKTVQKEMPANPKHTYTFNIADLFKKFDVTDDDVVGKSQEEQDGLNQGFNTLLLEVIHADPKNIVKGIPEGK